MSWERAGDVVFVATVALAYSSGVSQDGAFILSDAFDGVAALAVESEEFLLFEVLIVEPLCDVLPVEGVLLDVAVIAEILGFTPGRVSGNGCRTPALCIIITPLFVTEGGGQALCSVHSKKAFREA